MASLSLTRGDAPSISRANASPPTLTENTNTPLSTDLAGNLRTVGSGTQTVGGTVTANQGTAAAGTSAWPVVVFSGNSSIGTVTLAATNATASIGTVTLGVASAVLSLGTIQLAATNVTGSIGTVTIGPNNASIGTVDVQGLQASGAAAAGNPLLGGGRAATAVPTAVADGQVVALQLDKYGRLVTEVAPQDLWGQGQAILKTTTANAILASAGASTKWAIKTLGACSTQTATSTRVDWFNGASNATIYSFFFAAGISPHQANQTINFDPPWVGSAATQVLVNLGTAVTDVRVIITAFKVL